MIWQVVAGLAGGVGLFLLGMELMTDGLKLSVGKSLQQALKNSTRTPLRGIFFGALITSLVQSSSAVTVATIGFVNAGLMKIKHAIRLAYGSNLGTTMTGWLVATVGLHVHLKAFALPAVGIGMLMTLLIKQGRYPAIGRVITGFGLFFLGIDMMKMGFEGLHGLYPLEAIDGSGLTGLVAFVGAGFLMTVIMQSSSAAIAMTLTAAAGGIIALPSAACMVIGANVGTTSTAVISVIGATPNARRIAAGHVIFNVVTAIAALLILPLLLLGTGSFQQLSGMESSVATFLALFHTAFNVLGIALLWPFTRHLVAFLETRFVAAEEDEALPKYIDSTLLDTPELAHKALAKEIERIQAVSIRMAEDAISTETGASPRLRVDLTILNGLNDAVGNFCASLRKKDLPDDIANSLPMAMASTRYFADVAELAGEVDREQGREVAGIDEELEQLLSEMRRQAVAALEAVKQGEGMLEADSAVDALEKSYNSIKSQFLRAGATGKLTARHMVALIELVKSMERLGVYCVKGELALQAFSHQLSEKQHKESEAVEKGGGAIRQEGSEAG